MNNNRDEHNRAGLITFAAGMIVSLGLIIYLIAIHPGVDKNALQKLPAKELRTADNKVWEANPEAIKIGKDVYARNCASCHGPGGKGDGPAGVAIKARNLTKNDGDWKNGPGVFQMFKTLEEGIPGTAMASFAAIPEQDRWAVIHYMRNTFITNSPEPTEDEIRAFLETE